MQGYIMKRIINGVTFNTDTSTMLAQSEYEGSDRIYGKVPVVETLYQTRSGAFFVHRSELLELETEDTHANIRNTFHPMTRAEAQQWIEEGDIELIHPGVLDEPPEALPEDAPEATIYLRIPASLKERIEASAKAASLSVNSWALRCMERCLAAPAAE